MVYRFTCGYSHISGKFYAIEITVSGQAYGLDAFNGDLHHFSLIKKLIGIRVKRVYGHSNHLAVLTCSGQIMICGNGNNGQCGNGSNEGSNVFKLIKCNEKVVFSDAVVGKNHSIFITENCEAYSCGDNSHYQLCLCATKKSVLEPTPSSLFDGKAVASACGSYLKVIVTDTKKIKHTGMLAFGIKE